MVGTPSCFLIGATCLMAGWKTGAKKNVIPVSWKTSATRCGDKSSLMPSTSSISEEPVLPEADFDPCFITGTPDAEARIDAMLETFTVPTKSPPVPTISRASSPVSKSTDCFSITSTKPASSETVSPFERSANINAAISASLESPAMI